VNERGSVLILCLWVFILLALFAMSVAFRMRLATKIGGFEAHRFRQEYDFLSAVNLARFFIESDDEPKVDHSEDEWYGVPKNFGEIDFSDRFDLEIQDEESKASLNDAPERFLIEFVKVLKRNKIEIETDTEDLVGSILAWRGQTAVRGKPTLGFKHKRAPFESVEELRLIQFISARDAQRFKPFVTVYGQPQERIMKVNLNTVHPYILEALILSLAGGDLPKQTLREAIEKFRSTSSPIDGEEHVMSKQVFQQNDLRPQRFIRMLKLPDSVAIEQLVSQLMRHVTVDSKFFSVRVKLRSGKTASRAESRSRTLESVLGPRVFQHRWNTGDASSLTSAKPAGRPVTVPLEILFWREVVA